MKDDEFAQQGLDTMWHPSARVVGMREMSGRIAKPDTSTATTPSPPAGDVVRFDVTDDDPDEPLEAIIADVRDLVGVLGWQRRRAGVQRSVSTLVPLLFAALSL